MPLNVIDEYLRTEVDRLINAAATPVHIGALRTLEKCSTQGDRTSTSGGRGALH